jgi:exosortase A
MSTGWRIAGTATVVLLLAILVLYHNTVLYLASVWNEWRIGEYGHGYLVLVICLYLIYKKRKVLISLEPCPSIKALPAVAIAALLWLAATLVDVQSLQAVALLLLMLAVIWSALGPRITRHLLFPILFIGVALPVWSPLAVVLQEVTTDVVFWAEQIIGVPLMREGHTLILPYGQLSIEEACSGLRYFLAALTLGVLYAYLDQRGLRARLFIVLIAGATAILANILRVLIVVYVAYTTRMQDPLVTDHQSLGWMLFGGLAFLLVVLDHGFTSHVGTTTFKAFPANAPETTCKYDYLRGALQFAASLLLIIWAPAHVFLAQQSGIVPGETELFYPPAERGWSGPSETHDDWMPQYHGAIAGLRSYQRDDNTVYLYIGYYPHQSQGNELINELNQIADATIWRTVPLSTREITVDDLPVKEQVIISSTGRQRLIWYWYHIGGKQTTNRYIGKAFQVLGLLTGKTGASVTAVGVDIVKDQGDAAKLLREFVSVMGRPVAQFTDGKGISEVQRGRS